MAIKKEKVLKKNSDIILMDTQGKEVDEKDYFFSDGSEEEKKRGALVPPYFRKVCGIPVAREDMLEVFNSVFNPEDGFLFYKCEDKEVFIIIVPLVWANVDEEHGAVSGDAQKHAISFIQEGSVNLETLKMKLKRAAGTIKYENK